MQDQTKTIITEINKLADKPKADWWNNYLKNTVKFIGVGIPEIRKVLLKQKSGFENDPQLLEIADELISLKIAEHKLAGVLIYQLFLLDKIENGIILEHIESLFNNGYIYDWNTCDWLCVRVLTPVIDKGENDDISRILNWNTNENYWHARASLVPFAQCKTLKNHYKNLAIALKNLISREERFAKTVVGWVLREISKFDNDFVSGFLEANMKTLSKEVITNSLKYSDKNTKRDFVARWKEL
ncbi:MAG: hypothetical protein DRJ05_08635 [Bacteroidetes bacterium]|nr:MAG: hypothetical protein DRJ05_08635 [Bacteroidota bacterium]